MFDVWTDLGGRRRTVKPINRRDFGSKCASASTASVVVSDEDVTGFRTIDDGGGTVGGHAEFSGKANGAIVDRIGHRQQGRQVTIMSMQLRQTAEAEVSKMLTPEHCESRLAKTANKEITIHGRKLGVTVQRMKQRDSSNWRWIQQW